VGVVCGLEPGPGDTTLLAAYPDGERPVARVPWSAASRTFRRWRLRILDEHLLVPDLYRPWQRDASRAVRRRGLLPKGDVLATFGQPMSDHLLGLRLARRAGIPWIAHFSDPWTDNPFRGGGRLTRRLNARLEAAVVMRADALVFTSAETVELVLAKYPDGLRAKAHVLPHAYDPALYPDGARNDAEVSVRYLGNFYGHRGPEPLFRALRMLAESRPEVLQNVRVELVGSREAPLAEHAPAGLPGDLVRLREPVDYVESLSLMRASDLLLVLDAPGERSVFLPSKLVEYLGAGRPILALTPEGAAASFVRRVGGFHADPADADAAAGALAAALDSIRRGRSDLRAPRDVADTYAAPAVAARFWELVQRVREEAI
jgi:glycosyltransferase involved in cell wall biosynthesis